MLPTLMAEMARAARNVDPTRELQVRKLKSQSN